MIFILKNLNKRKEIKSNSYHYKICNYTQYVKLLQKNLNESTVWDNVMCKMLLFHIILTNRLALKQHKVTRCYITFV